MGTVTIRNTDPVVRATAVTTTPDLAVIAALDAALAGFGRPSVTIEEGTRWAIAAIRD